MDYLLGRKQLAVYSIDVMTGLLWATNILLEIPGQSVPMQADVIERVYIKWFVVVAQWWAGVFIRFVRT